MSEEEQKQLEFQRELYIFGEPVETEFGTVRFLTYKEYLENIPEVSAIGLNVLHIYYHYRKMFDEKDEDAMRVLDELKEQSLYDIIRGANQFYDAYVKIFKLVLDNSEMADQIFESEEGFTFMRELVMGMNIITEEEVNPNPEIQKGIDMSRKLKQQGAEKQSFSDIVSSIVAGTSNSFKDVCNMSVYQVYSIFYRIGALKAYDTSTLFATVSEDVKIESWSKHIDLFERETSGIKKKDFDSKYGKIL